jgi:exonuclease III
LKPIFICLFIHNLTYNQLNENIVKKITCYNNYNATRTMDRLKSTILKKINKKINIILLYNMTGKITKKRKRNNFGYGTDNLTDSCYKWKLCYKKKYICPQKLEKKQLKIMSMNIWGLAKRGLAEYNMMEKRMKYMSKLINHETPDIICLQEMSHESFGFLSPHVKKYYCSETSISSAKTLLKQRNRTLEIFFYLKYKPEYVEIYSVGGNVGYDNSVGVVVYSNLVIFNIYVQAGSKFSPGQENVASHYSRCRGEQYKMIYDQIKKNISSKYKNREIIICGDFNSHLDGNKNEWSELNEIRNWKTNFGIRDSYRELYPNKQLNNGYTEDTDHNLMRWNTKFMRKRFRYDGIFISKNITPIDIKIVGTKSFDLTKKETEMVKEYLIINGMKENNLVYTNKKNVLDWWISDHFGLCLKFSVN